MSGNKYALIFVIIYQFGFWKTRTKQGYLVDKTPRAIIKHNELTCGNNTLAVDDGQQVGAHKSGKGMNYT